MKKVLVFIALAAVLSACNTQQKVTTYFKKHCPNSSITKLNDGSYKVEVKCENLYDTVDLKKYIQKGIVTYDFAGATVSGLVVSKDSIPDIYTILKKISKGVKH